MCQHKNKDSKQVKGEKGEINVSIASETEDEKTALPTGEIQIEPDGGYGWLVVFASFVLLFIGDGIGYTIGLFCVQFSKEFEDSGKWAIGLVPSIMIATTHAVGPIGSILVNRFGCRVVSIFGSFLATLGFALCYFAQTVSIMYIYIGLMAGVGFGFLYLPSIVAVPHYFHKRRALAVGLTVTGSAIGTLFFEYVVGRLLLTFSWRQSIVITAGIIFISTPFAFIYRDHRKPKQTSSQKDCSPNSSTSTNSNSNSCESSSQSDISLSESEIEDKETPKLLMDWTLLKNQPFVLFAVADFCTSLGFNTVYIYFPDIEQEIDKSESVNHQSTLLGVIAFSTIVSRVVFGYCSDQKINYRHLLYQTSIGLAGIVTGSVPFLQKSKMQLRILACLYGVSIGAYVSLKPVILVDLIGLKNLTNSFGLLLLFQALGFLIGIPTVGYFHDLHGAYNLGFYCSGGAIVLSALILCLVPLCQLRLKTKLLPVTVLLPAYGKTKL